MNEGSYTYKGNNTEFKGFLSFDKSSNKKRPAVIVVHDWSGCNDFAKEKTKQLAELGYIGFAIDMYGEGKIGQTITEKQNLIEPLMKDRSLLRTRIVKAYESLLSLEYVDANNIAVIGFCFGGLCALDLARSGVNIKGTISFHGLLNKPDKLPSKDIKSKILALHGYDDPMVTPSQVNAFCQEMTEAKADWQVCMYGHTKHAFTNPQAHDEKLGTVYDSKAAHRSWQAMKDFLTECFA